jgi:hypothetical protein
VLDLRVPLPFRLQVYSPKLLNECRSNLVPGFDIGTLTEMSPAYLVFVRVGNRTLHAA